MFKIIAIVFVFGALLLAGCNAKDIFLYNHPDRREKPKSSSVSSTHTSSSGTTHGGGGSKF